MLAAAFGRVNIVKLLLDRGANVNMVDNKGRYAVHWCVVVPGEREKEATEISMTLMNAMELKPDLNSIMQLRYGKIQLQTHQLF
jgi:ankyrin repeat protein